VQTYVAHLRRKRKNAFWQKKFHAQEIMFGLEVAFLPESKYTPTKALLAVFGPDSFAF
jgi:hypothetical protein